MLIKKNFFLFQENIFWLKMVIFIKKKKKNLFDRKID
jgi:hypothetical protein